MRCLATENSRSEPLRPLLLDLFERLPLGLRHCEVDPYPADDAEQGKQPEGHRTPDRPDERQEELAHQVGGAPVYRGREGDASPTDPRREYFVDHGPRHRAE